MAKSFNSSWIQHELKKEKEATQKGHNQKFKSLNHFPQTSNVSLVKVKWRTSQNWFNVIFVVPVWAINKKLILITIQNTNSSHVILHTEHWTPTTKDYGLKTLSLIKMRIFNPLSKCSSLLIRQNVYQVPSLRNIKKLWSSHVVLAVYSSYTPSKVLLFHKKS